MRLFRPQAVLDAMEETNFLVSAGTRTDPQVLDRSTFNLPPCDLTVVPTALIMGPQYEISSQTFEVTHGNGRRPHHYMNFLYALSAITHYDN